MAARRAGEGRRGTLLTSDEKVRASVAPAGLLFSGVCKNRPRKNRQRILASASQSACDAFDSAATFM